MNASRKVGRGGSAVDSLTARVEIARLVVGVSSRVEVARAIERAT